MDSELVQSLGTSLFSGIGNVLNAASSDAGVENEEAEEDREAELDSEAMKEKVSVVLPHNFIFSFYNPLTPANHID